MTWLDIQSNDRKDSINPKENLRFEYAGGQQVF